MLRLTALLMHDIKNMSKVLRHTLGDRMVSRALDALDNLSEGYLSKDVPSARLEALRMMKVNISRLKTLLRLCNEAREFSEKRLTDYFVRIEDIESTPITPEILKANGFVEHCGGIFRYEWMWQGESSGITLCSFDEEHWFVDLFFKEGKDIMCNIPTFSVHQLQHILRLAGVDKEIVMPNK